MDHLKIYYRIHNPYQRVNSHIHAHYSTYYDAPTLHIVNQLIQDDLKHFDYEKCEKIEDFKKTEVAVKDENNLLYHTTINLDGSEEEEEDEEYQFIEATANPNPSVEELHFIYPQYHQEEEKKIESMIKINESLDKMIQELQVDLDLNTKS